MKNILLTFGSGIGRELNRGRRIATKLGVVTPRKRGYRQLRRWASLPCRVCGKLDARDARDRTGWQISFGQTITPTRLDAHISSNDYSVA